MSKIINVLISKKSYKIVQLFFLLSCLINIVNSEFTDESMKASLVFGLGIGTFVVIICIGIGIIVCLFGLAFPFPGLFIFIGMVLPLIAFIFFSFCPTKSEKEDDNKNENHNKNVYIVARWIHFLVMVLLFLGLLAPAFIMWGINVIPQRVDSSSQKDLYDERYLEAIEKQKKRKYNLEETDILLPSNRLGMNKKRNVFTRNTQNSINNNSLINSQNNISNNLIDNTNAENSNEFPRPILPRSTKRNEFNENRKKFTGFIRKKDNK